MMIGIPQGKGFSAMPGNSTRRYPRWMQTARRFSWLLAALLILNQGFVLYDNYTGPGEMPNSLSLAIASLPAQPSDCTLSKQETRTIASAMVRTIPLTERPFVSGICSLPLNPRTPRHVQRVPFIVQNRESSPRVSVFSGSDVWRHPPARTPRRVGRYSI